MLKSQVKSQQIQTKPGPFARINPLTSAFPCKSFTDSKLPLIVAKEHKVSKKTIHQLHGE